MIIEQKPKLFSKEWKQWFHLRFRQRLYDELERQRQQILSEIYETLQLNGYKYRHINKRKHDRKLLK